jgi:hypothetical protein
MQFRGSGFEENLPFLFIVLLTCPIDYGMSLLRNRRMITQIQFWQLGIFVLFIRMRYQGSGYLNLPFRSFL